MIGEWGIAALAGLAAGLLAWGFAAVYREALAGGEDRYGERVGEDLPPVWTFLIPYARALAAFLDPVLTRLSGAGWGRAASLVQVRIRQAGNPGEILPAELLGLSGVSGLAALIAGGLFGLALGLEPSARGALALSGLLLGGSLPWIWLFDQASRRQRLILRTLPYAIDLMTLSVEAGLDFAVAIRRIVEKLGATPLAAEFAVLLREIQMGKSRREALRAMKERVHMMDMDFFASALIQADEMGVGLGPTLRAQSEGIRQRRFLRAEELAMKAPVKIIFPLVAFVLPVTLVMILGPLAIQLWVQFGGMMVR